MIAAHHNSNDEIAAVRRVDAMIWAMIAIVAAIILTSATITDFRIVWRSYATICTVSASLLAASWFCRAKRNEPRLSLALGAAAQILVFSAVVAPLSYLAASFGLPLKDDALEAADRALGFDWMALLATLNAHPTVFAIMRAFYFSLMLQAVFVVLCLAFTGRLASLRIFILAFMSAAIITIAISAVVPAQGVWSHHGFAVADVSSIVPATRAAWPVYDGLRDGTYRLLVAAGSEGIITFPSLHAALTVILIGAMWPVPGVRWLGLAANLVVIAATPIDGSHYLIDVLAGIAIAIVSLAAGREVCRWAGRRSRSQIAAERPRLVPGE